MATHFINKIPASVRYMLISALAFALMSSCVKLVSTYGIPIIEIVAARALISFIISYIDVKRKKISIWGHNKKLLLTRGIVGSFALICVYFSVATLPLAEATLLQYLHPVFTAILAIIFLKEKIKTSTVLCIILCMTGLLVIIAPGFTFENTTNLPLLSIMVALLGALGSAIAYVIVKRLSNHEDSSVIIFYFPLISLPLSILLLGNNFVMPNTEALILLLFVGIFTQVGQIGLTKAMQTEQASKATAYSYIQVIFSIILGGLLFSEVPSIWTLSGGFMIITGAFINIFGGTILNSLKSKRRQVSGS